jgi:hypothetical protein
MKIIDEMNFLIDFIDWESIKITILFRIIINQLLKAVFIGTDSFMEDIHKFKNFLRAKTIKLTFKHNKMREYPLISFKNLVFFKTRVLLRILKQYLNNLFLIFFPVLFIFILYINDIKILLCSLFQIRDKNCLNRSLHL